MEQESIEKILMTKEEMIERINSGEDPFDIVIDKWERIKKVIESGQYLSVGFFSSSTCALCFIHPMFCDGSEGLGLLDCPLYSIGECCDLPESAWGRFARDSKNPERAQDMINAVKKSRNPGGQ